MSKQTNFFEFSSDHPDKLEFQVLDYEAVESMSTLYEYRIRVLSPSAGLDPLDLIKYRGHFKINFGGSKTFMAHGNVEGLNFVKAWQLGLSSQSEMKYEYEFLLVPAVVNLDRYKRTRVYLNKSLVDIIEQILKEHNIDSTQYRLDLIQGNYKDYEFIFQYCETDFDFLRYWFERYGIYFYFEQPVDGASEVLVITDKNSTHKTDELAPALAFRDSASLDNIFGKAEVNFWSDKVQQIPSKVLIRGYNYEKASTAVQIETEVQDATTGTVNIFDELIWTEDQAKAYGEVWRDIYRASQAIYSGLSYGMVVIPGKMTQVIGHYFGRFNKQFLVTAVKHQGSMRKSWLSTRIDVSKLPDVPLFQCQFTCLAGNVQYRDPIETKLNRIDGLLQATIDSGSTADLADIDDYGRYKISFIQEEKPEGDSGKHSHRVRKQEYYVGNKYGVHHPMRPGVEVLVGFVNGNPNAPLITGAVFNSQNMNIVSAESAYENRHISGSGQKNITNEKDGFTINSDGNDGAMIAIGNTQKARSAYWKPPPMVKNPFD